MTALSTEIACCFLVDSKVRSVSIGESPFARARTCTLHSTLDISVGAWDGPQV